MEQKERIQWLALLRGLNIILVVMYHVRLIDLATGETNSFCYDVCLPFNSFRMPLFIFCSGGLLYLSRINKGWNTKDLYKDKFYRIVIPFLFFVTFYYLLKVGLSPLVKTKAVLSISFFLESFAIYPNHPSAHLWFLAVLFWFMLLYPLFCWLCQNKVRTIVFLLFTMAIYFLNIDYSDNWFYIFSLNKYLVFFFSGIVFFRFRIYQYTDNLICLFSALILYVLCFWYDIALLESLTGIVFMISLCQWISHYWPALFSSFREYIYQIFLMSFIFQPMVELVLWQRLFYNEQLFLFFYILNVLSGIFMPVLISKLAERYGPRWLKICLGLKGFN